MRLVGNNLSPAVVVQKNLTKISTLKRQTMGSPLTHPNTMSKALTTRFENHLTHPEVRTWLIKS